MRNSERQFLERARELAEAGEAEGDPPVGAVVVADGELVGEGRCRVPTGGGMVFGHAELHALQDVDDSVWSQASETTCICTLEPCPTCVGALLAHGVRRVLFGSPDPVGGAGAAAESFAVRYGDASFEWVGPVARESFAGLAERALDVLGERTVGAEPWWSQSVASGSIHSKEASAEALDAWLDEPEALTVQEARKRLESLAERTRVGELLPYAVALFRRGGFLKDFRRLERWTREADSPEILEEIEPTLARDLPDIWVRRALEDGDVERAVERWFEIEGHPRSRLVADELVDACAGDRVQLIISCRLARISHLVERGSRRRYRRACRLLRELRDELERARAGEFWHHVLEDLREEYDNRPAFLDELAEAGLTS